jgi:hypothetical protein
MATDMISAIPFLLRRKFKPGWLNLHDMVVLCQNTTICRQFIIKDKDEAGEIDPLSDCWKFTPEVHTMRIMSRVAGIVGTAVISTIAVSLAFKGMKFAAKTAFKGGAIAYAAKRVLANRSKNPGEKSPSMAGAELENLIEPEPLQRVAPIRMT